jgi:hypothetical protein
MSIRSFGIFFKPTSAIVIPASGRLTEPGIDLINALYLRTGAGTGIVPQVSAALAAKGASIADALLLAADWNYIGTTPAGSGVLIMPLKPGNDVEIWNAGANNLNVYPPSAVIQIDALGAGSPYVLVPGKLRAFQCWTTNQFLSFGN